MRRASSPAPPWCIAAVLALAGAAGATETPADPLREIKSESLFYNVRAWQGSKVFTINVGSCMFTLARDDAAGEPQLVLCAAAKAGVPAYPYEATMVSRLRDSDYQPRDFFNQRTKKSYKKRWLHFVPGGVNYLKHKHCDAPTLCHNPAHLAKQSHRPGCHDPAHYVWSFRRRQRFDGRAWDMLSAIYLARALDLQPGGPTRTIRVATTSELLDVDIRAVGEETITVPAGIFPCLKIALDSRTVGAADADDADSEGFFGLQGSAELFVDRQSHHLVLIRGKVKLGANFDVEVALQSRKVETQ